jgi:hypothetical protein
MLLYTLSSYRASTKQSSNWHALSEEEKKGEKNAISHAEKSFANCKLHNYGWHSK